MSRGSQETRAEILKELVGEFRQFNALGASFFRAAAARSGMAVTDMQVIDILASAGPLTAGQLADLTGLTTGAIAGILNRLEEAELVRRERDPNDGRRVIVHLERDKDKMREISPIFDAFGQEWNEVASLYDDEQLAFLLEVLKRSNTLSRKEIVRLQEAPEGQGEIYSAPLLGAASGRLVVSSGTYQLDVRADSQLPELYVAHFDGPAPEVKVKDGVVTIRYPRRLWMLGVGQGAADVALNTSIPWSIAIQGGTSSITAELAGLRLSGLEVKGGLSTIRLELPVPSGAVPIRISGGASDISVRRPAGIAARVHLKGWASYFTFDDQIFSNLGNDVRMQSANFEAGVPYYDIEVSSSVSSVSITTD